MLDARTLHESVARLKHAQPKLFGADMHDFRFYPCLAPEDVRLFETTHKIALPEDYRRYLLEVSNGGAGPFYGVFKLGEVDADFGFRPWSESDGLVGIPSTPWAHSEAWNDLTGYPVDEESNEEGAFDKVWEAFTERYWSDHLVNGAIPICHEGCAVRDFLVVTGDEAGHVWVDARASNGGIYPATSDGSDRLTFTEWYLNWLNNALAGLR